LEENRKKKYFFSNKDLIKLFIPLIIEQILAYFVGVADSIMVVSVGEAAVSGVSLVDFIMQLLISVFVAIATGGAVVAGQYLGNKEKKKSEESLKQLVLFCTMLSLFVMALLYFIKPFILNVLFGAITDEVRANANIYFLIVAASIPFLALYSVGAAIFRTRGNSKAPMYVMFFMNLVNVFGNALGVYIFKMGVAGIAIPTLVSRIGAGVIVMAMVTNKKDELSLKIFRKMKLQWSGMCQILHIAVPYGMENGLFYLGRLMILTIVSTFGTAAIAANSVAGTLVPFQVLPAQAIGLGLTVVISQCIGAGDYEQARYYSKKIMGSAIAACFVTCVLILLILPLLLRIYNLSDIATELTRQIVWSHGVLCIILWPLGNLTPVIFRAAGDARYPMIVSIVVMFLVRIGLAYVLSCTLKMGMFGTWIAMYCDWAVKAVLHVIRYFSRKWLHYRAI